MVNKNTLVVLGFYAMDEANNVYVDELGFVHADGETACTNYDSAFTRAVKVGLDKPEVHQALNLLYKRGW